MRVDVGEMEYQVRGMFEVGGAEMEVVSRRSAGGCHEGYTRWNARATDGDQEGINAEGAILEGGRRTMADTAWKGRSRE